MEELLGNYKVEVGGFGEFPYECCSEADVFNS